MDVAAAGRGGVRHTISVGVTLMGRGLLVKDTPAGPRALIDGKVVTAEAAQRYLKRSFGANLDRVRRVMQGVAATYAADELRRTAFSLYERFRPGSGEWGQHGSLDLDVVLACANRRVLEELVAAGGGDSDDDGGGGGGGGSL